MVREEDQKCWAELVKIQVSRDNLKTRVGGRSLAHFLSQTKLSSPAWQSRYREGPLDICVKYKVKKFSSNKVQREAL